jgi:hypothetical protein
MGRASDRLARHSPFSHLYLRTIMMALALVATTLFAILLSLSPHASTSTPPHSQQRVQEHAPPPRIRLTPAPTRLAQWLLHVHENISHHRFRCHRTSHSSSRPSPCSSSPTCCPHPRLQPRVDQRSSTWVQGESVMLLDFLCACRPGGHGGACHA